ncbi:hypothetical protein N7520_004943 [Penicillium odoratum]|uniref:uncharacterized protein n=1 Tax=Penicillium odoratum TaxID=1167516 RepID=UPI0025480878|nr:uncharacterized protein N7520_004943 [Penicillium odoratum]KAJ5765384.1 hypothetical protein N7520_004943 [Penicillium odoratum]
MAPTSIKTSLLLIAQLKLALDLALAPRAGLTLATFESLNSTAACPIFVVGQSYCVVSTVTAATTTTSSTSSTSSTTSTTSTSSSSTSTKFLAWNPSINSR